MVTNKPYSLLSFAFWRAYFVTLRPYLFFVSGASGLVGLALAPKLTWGGLVAAHFAFFFSYGLGQALTDVTQVDTDSISSPYRPLTQGLITGKQVLAVSLTGLSLCALVFLWLNPWTLVLSAAGVVGLATYTPLKRRFWGGPPWNSWIVALLPAMGFLCGAVGLRPMLGDARLGLAMLSIFASYAIFVLLGYFKDISADRATGYDTFAVHFGWMPTVWLSLAHALVHLVASAWLLALLGVLRGGVDTARVGVAALWVVGAALTLLGHAQMARTRDEKAAHGPIGVSLRGYVLVHLAEAAAARRELALVAFVYYALFELALWARPEKSQV